MTTPFRRTAKCPNCNYDIPLEDEISDWIRHHPKLRSGDGFTFMDKDLICHRFKTTHGREFQCLMFIEFKSLGRQLDDTQRDTMHMTNQMFRTDCTTPTKKRKTHTCETSNRVWSAKSKQWVAVKAFGFHLVRMNGRTPDSSTQILWDKREITKDDLVALLQFNLNPDSLHPMNWRIHHSKPKENLLPI